LKIGVCIKSTPDTDARIKVQADGSGVDFAGIKFIISPYDTFALEQGVLTKEKLGGDVVLYSAGNADVEKILRDGLALGADSAVHINDPAVYGSDALGVAKALAASMKKDGIGLIFTGKQSIDDDNGQLPAMLAELLGWTHLTMVKEFQTDGTTFTAVRNLGGGVEEVVRGKLPAVIAADRGLNTPRYAKLPEIMKAKKKPLEVRNAAALGLAAADLAPKAKVSAYGAPTGRTKGKIIAGDSVDAKVKELVRLLRDEAKVL